MAELKKIYHLSTCSTCKRILGEIDAARKGYFLQDVKATHITAKELDELKALTGSYESLFSRRAIKYKEMGLKDKKLTESDYRKLILEEYTFLKRPIALKGGKIYIGNEVAEL